MNKFYHVIFNKNLNRYQVTSEKTGQHVHSSSTTLNTSCDEVTIPKLRPLSKKLATLCMLASGYLGSTLNFAHAVETFRIDASNSEIKTVGLLQTYLGYDTLNLPNTIATGPNSFKYVSVLFRPDTTATYTFGQTKSPYDTVMVLYDGIFDPLNPGNNALIGNDDTDPSLHQAIVGSGVPINCYSDYWCPQVTYDLIAGQVYSLFISVYNPITYNLGFPIDFYSSLSGSFVSPTVIPPIDTAEPYYLGSDLDFLVNPIFKGGTLRLDTNLEYANTLTAYNVATNTIDQFGNVSRFTGSIVDAAPGEGAPITITNSGVGGSVTFAGVNTYTGSTTIAGATLRLEGLGDISASNALNLTATNSVFDISGIDTSSASIQNLSGVTGAQVLLSNKDLQINNSANTTFAGTLSGTGTVIKDGNGQLVFSAAQPYTGATTIAAGTLKLEGQGDIAASSSINLTGTNSILDVTGVSASGVTLQNLSGVDGAQLRLANKDLQAVNTANTNLGATISGTGTLSKSGNGELILSGSGATIGNVSVNEGTLKFMQNGDFTVSGDYTTTTGTTTNIGQLQSTLNIGGTFTQASGATLNITLGAPPDIKANQAQLAGKLFFSGFSGDDRIVSASDVMDGSYYTMISTTNGITGAFDEQDGIDYIISDGFVSPDDKNYLLGFGLAWTQGGQVDGTGNFTMVANTAFDVDIALNDQTLPASGFASGWNGKDLVQRGAGDLYLSAVNGYTGVTTIEGGRLFLSEAGDISSSSQVTLAGSTATLDLQLLTAATTTINNLSGVTGANINLSDKNLSIHNTQDTVYAGDFDVLSTGGITKEGPNSLTLSGNTRYTGETRLNEGDLILDGINGGAQLQSNVIGQTGTSLSLINGATLTGWIDPTTVNIDANSTWNMTANSVVDTVNLAGAINFVAPSLPMTTGRTLTTYDWVGNGGTVNMYAVLGNSSSVSDQIIIDGGSATGNTHLVMNNAGGLGDQTTADGIKVVATKNGATTATDAFDMPKKVLAGAYEYSLARGGATGGTENDWFLTSQKVRNDGTRTNFTNFRAETALYSTITNELGSYGEETLGNLRERMGSIEELAHLSERFVWGHSIFQTQDNGRTPQSNTAIHASQLVGLGNGINNQAGIIGVQNAQASGRSNTAALQVGSDVYVKQGDQNSRTSMGLYAVVGHITSKINQFDGIDTNRYVGENKTTAYGLGAYLTYLNPTQGLYVDSVLQATHYDISARSVNGQRLSTNGLGLAASIEVGKRFNIGQDLTLEPQLQFVYQNINVKDANDQGSRVKFGSKDTYSTRLGVRLAKAWDVNTDYAKSAWVSLNLLNTSGDRARTSFVTPTQGDVTFQNALPGTRLGLQVGFEGRLNKNLVINTRLGAERSIDRKKITAYTGYVGLRMEF